MKWLTKITLTLLIIYLVMSSRAIAADVSSATIDTLINLGTLGGFLTAAMFYVTNQITSVKRETLHEIRDLTDTITKLNDDADSRSKRNLKHFLKLYDKVNQIVRVSTAIQAGVEVNEANISDIFAKLQLTKRKNSKVVELLHEVTTAEQLQGLLEDVDDDDVLK